MADASDIQRALHFLRKKNVSEAVAALERTVEQIPAHLMAHALLARAYELQQAWAKALQSWDEAYMLMPTSPLVKTGRQRVLQHLEKASRDAEAQAQSQHAEIRAEALLEELAADGEDDASASARVLEDLLAPPGDPSTKALPAAPEAFEEAEAAEAEAAEAEAAEAEAAEAEAAEAEAAEAEAAAETSDHAADTPPPEQAPSFSETSEDLLPADVFLSESPAGGSSLPDLDDTEEPEEEATSEGATTEATEGERVEPEAPEPEAAEARSEPSSDEGEESITGAGDLQDNLLDMDIPIPAASGTEPEEEAASEEEAAEARSERAPAPENTPEETSEDTSLSVPGGGGSMDELMRAAGKAAAQGSTSEASQDTPDRAERPEEPQQDQADASAEAIAPGAEKADEEKADEDSSDASTEEGASAAGAAASGLQWLREQTNAEVQRSSARSQLSSQDRSAQKESSGGERSMSEPGSASEIRDETGDLDRLIRELESARITPDPTPLDEEEDNASYETDLELEYDVEDLVSETLGRIYAAQGRYREASRIYVKLAAQEPNRTREHLERASELRVKSDTIRETREKEQGADGG